MDGGRDPFFGFDPFGSFGGFGSFGHQRSLISSFFGGRSPFDDPFFTRPFGSMFESSFFGSTGVPFMNPSASGFLEHQSPQTNASRGTASKGPVIQELSSDDETEDRVSEKERKGNLRKHGRSSLQPLVEHPDDEGAEKKSKHLSQRDISLMHHVQPQPQTHSYTFESSSVSYGGANGTYHTSSRTRRTGSDGLTFEECKEADSTSRQATHRVSRGIHDKGHSVTRKLKSDGHVDTLHTLHNLDKYELVGFEDAWRGNARKQFPGWSEGFAAQETIGSASGYQQRPNRGGWALPSVERSNLGSFRIDAGDGAGVPSRHSGMMKKNRPQ